MRELSRAWRFAFVTSGGSRSWCWDLPENHGEKLELAVGSDVLLGVDGAARKGERASPAWR